MAPVIRVSITADDRVDDQFPGHWVQELVIIGIVIIVSRVTMVIMAKRVAAHWRQGTEPRGKGSELAKPTAYAMSIML